MHGLGLKLCLVVIFAMSFLGAQATLTPSKAEALPSPCSLIPDPAARKICKMALKSSAKAVPGVGPLVGTGVPGIPNPGDVIADAGKDALGGVLKSFVGYASDGVLEVLSLVFGAVRSTSQFDPIKTWYLKIYAMLFAFATITAIGGVYKRWLMAVKNKDPGDIGKAVAEFVFFFLWCGSLPWLYRWLVHTGDNGIAPAFMDLAGKNAAETMRGLRKDFDTALNAVDAGKALILPVIYLIGGLGGAVFTQVALFARDGMMFIMLAAWVVVHGAHVGRFATDETFARTVMGNVALILFLPILVVILVISLMVFNNGDGARTLLLGSIMLMLVPYFAVKAYKRISQQDFEVMPTVRAGLGYGGRIKNRFTS